MIKKWKKFIESISGLPLADTAPIGPNSPRQELRTTLSSKDTNVLTGIDGNFYTESDYMELFNEIMKQKTLDQSLRSFNQLNLDTLLQISKSEN